MENCKTCAYYNRSKKYCEYKQCYIDSIYEGNDCWGYKDVITMRTHKWYQDDYSNNEIDNEIDEDYYVEVKE